MALSFSCWQNGWTAPSGICEATLSDLKFQVMLCNSWNNRALPDSTSYKLALACDVGGDTNIGQMQKGRIYWLLLRFTKTQNITSLPECRKVGFIGFCCALLRRKILRLYRNAERSDLAASVALLLRRKILRLYRNAERSDLLASVALY
jgi:hypothetical protein